MSNLKLEDAILSFCGFLVAVTMREAARAIASRTLGDRSSETESRATLNPLPHIDVLGTIVLPLVFLLTGTPFLLGWAKPLNIDTRYFKRIRRDINLAEIAGPGINFALPLLCGVIAVIFGYENEMIAGGADPVPRLLMAIAQANIVIGLLNLLPFPNSSGWRLLLNNISYEKGQKLNEQANVITIVLFALLLTGILSPLFRGAIDLYRIVLYMIA